MSVKRSDYIVIGLNIGYDKFDDDFYDNEEIEKLMDSNKAGQMTFLPDGMSGKYFVVGEVIKCDPNGYDGIGLNMFSTTRDTPFVAIKERVRTFIKEQFGIDEEPQLIVLTHWT